MPAKAGIHDFLPAVMRKTVINFETGGWVYFMSNRPNGIVYAGVTADLIRRAYEHREGLINGFTKKYGLRRLIYYERHDSIVEAIAREKRVKDWKRAYKIRLIHGFNPSWDDLYHRIV